MNYKFKANHIFTQSDDYMDLIGFADAEHEPNQFLILQKSHQYDNQDKELGMDKIYIQVEDESRSKYGGIKTICINKDTIQITLTNEGKNALKIKNDIEIQLNEHNCSTNSKVISHLKALAKAENIDFIEK